MKLSLNKKEIALIDSALSTSFDTLDSEVPLGTIFGRTAAHDELLDEMEQISKLRKKLRKAGS